MPAAVPTIDLSPWAGGSAATRAALAAEVDAAARGAGFLQLLGHALPLATAAAALAAADAFYALPPAEKAASAPPTRAVNRGYSPPRAEALALSLPRAPGAPPPRPDTFEAFNVGEDAVDYADPFFARERGRFFAENIWPPRPHGFRASVVAYFEEAKALAHTLVDVFAVALGMEEGHFRPIVDRSTTTMRLIHYDPAEDSKAAAAAAAEREGQEGGGGEGGAGPSEQQRMGAHTDYGMVTVLYADPVPGLQILDSQGEWCDVTPEPGAILVNFGDMMAEMTNDRWKSTYGHCAAHTCGCSFTEASQPRLLLFTDFAMYRLLLPSPLSAMFFDRTQSLHRVVPSTKRRRSIAFFLDANYDATISCLPTCVSEDNPARYEPFNAGDHLMAKILGPRTGTVSQALDTTRGRAGYR